MNSKTKFTLTVTAMVAVTLFAIVGIMAVFAARQQSFSTSITVVYKSTSVEGTATAQWKLSRWTGDSANGSFFGSSWNDMDSNGEQAGGETQLDLSADGPLSLSPAQTIELSDEHPAVAFKYVFTNTAEHPYTLNLTYQPNTDTKNVNVFYDISSEDMSDGPLCYLADKFPNMIDMVVPSGSSEYIYIVLVIDDFGTDSMFDGTFNIELNGQSSDFNEDYIYLFDGTNTMLVDTLNPDATTLDTTGLTYKDVPVNMIRKTAFFSNANLQNVILNGIREIGASAFNSCTGITNITFGDDLVTIGEKAFYECKNIESVTIPRNVKLIGSQAFSYCSQTVIKVDSENVNYTSKNNSGEEIDCIIEKATKKLIYSKGTIPDDGSIKAIGSYAIENFTIDSLTIPQCIEHIEIFAFSNVVTPIINYYAENVADDILKEQEGASASAFFGFTSSDEITLTIGEDVKHIPVWFFGPYTWKYPSITTAIINSVDIYKELLGKESNIAGYLLGAVESCNGIIKVKADIVDGNDMPEYLQQNYTKGDAVDGYYTFTKIAS